ncbi:MAG: SpoIVB peptidase [Clostridia bacterium]|jgi:stage IV sporulation protein B|nr:SpoIVB peptidase [Clostridia bacterium]
MKKIGNKIILLIFLLILYTYVCNITMLPSNYILLQGEDLKLRTIIGLSVQEKETLKTLQTVSNISSTKAEKVGKIDLKVSLFNLFPVKNISVNVIPKTTVVPVGKAIGMKLYTQGVLVVGMSEIEGKKPYENSGIQEGDRIIQINQNTIQNTEDLMQEVNNCNGNAIHIQYVRNEKTITTSILPVKNEEDQYKIGLWVRDAAAGVGTLTFYEPSTKMFASLGHGILDVDTSQLIKIENGELVTTNILSVVKGEKGTPGEIRGTIESGYTIGDISKNTAFGVFGSLNKPTYLSIDEKDEMEIALREEIKQGKAQIICELENGKRKYYDIEIQKVFTHNNNDNKSMLIKVIDEELIAKTGGIVQGMSGAPIIQNGKFVGAVTHVLVNDPTMGYGVFADIMLKQMREVEK